ncbi:unnamed protein product [Ambrosiozyma monospora]|uniref:Unnamed protein product n=1 Tax=Ambrosiozyma monospora TaxID=43982 RepID=A0A9W7DD43_AMBMO|nr:unnamed protein product [Ambrosiozyma monospora]
MSRSAQLEQDNEAQFNLLASKISAFKNVANDINNYAQEDTNTMNTLNGQFNSLMESVKSTSHKLSIVMNRNPRLVKLVGGAVGIFFILYFTLKWLF